MSRRALFVLLCSTYAASLPACFGTGVAPAKHATLVADETVALVSQSASTLTVTNNNAKAAVAQNVRLQGRDGAPLPDGLVEVRYGASCQALAPGGSCVISVTPGPNARPDDFPLVVRVVGDNTNAVTVTLNLGEGSGAGASAGVDRIVVGSVVLAPPAPATAALSVRNRGRTDVTLAHVTLPDEANLVVDVSTCPSYPRLPAGGNCTLTLRAEHDAAPGVYPLQISYQGTQGPARLGTTATVLPGALVLNDGAAITLDSNTSVQPISLRNHGFDVHDLQVSLPWSDECRGAPSLTLDAGGCATTLAAGATCTLNVQTLGATPGVGSVLTATANQRAALRTQETVRIGSLLAHGLRFVSPGVQVLQLDNLTAKPLSVLAVRVGGNRAGGLSVPTAAQLASCQRFVGSCQVPIEASVDAFVEGGAAGLTVTYTDGTDVAQAAAGVQVAQANVTVNNGAALTLPSDAGNVTVPLKNDGAFAVVAPSLQLVPPLAGVRITTDCPEILAPGASCNATVVRDVTTQTGATANLVPTGANVASSSVGQPVAVQVALLAVGVDTHGAAALMRSYDAGATWSASPNVPAGFVGLKAALSDRVWLVAGSQDGNQALIYSSDRGQSWQPATLAPQAGALRAVAAAANGFVAVGDCAGTAVVRTSRDGASWSAPVAGLRPAVLRAVACNQRRCVATGDGDALDNAMALHTADGGNTWAPLAADWVGPGFAGTLHGAAVNGNVWALAGSSSGNNQVLLASSGDGDGPYNVDTGGVHSGSGTLRAVASNGAQWLAVGADSSAQLVTDSASATADAWPGAAVNLYPGLLNDVVWSGAAWIAVGNNGAGAGVVCTSSDGGSWTTTAVPSVSDLTGIAATR